MSQWSGQTEVRVIDSGPSSSVNPFAALVSNQRFALVNKFELESGRVLLNVEVAFKTWGKLNERADNVRLLEQQGRKRLGLRLVNRS